MDCAGAAAAEAVVVVILSGASIQARHIIRPHLPRTEILLPDGRRISYGESLAGYDIRIRETVTLPMGRTVLASTIEEFRLPNDVLGVVHDKSSWARRGVSVQNTVLEPGWRGWLTLELLLSPLVNATQCLTIEAGLPVGQVVFHQIDQSTAGYGDGKYQDQPPRPVDAL